MLKLPFANADEASINTLFGVAGQALQGAEQLIALNLQATNTTLAEFAELVAATLSEKNPAELAKLQIAALQAAPEKALAYGRQVKEIFEGVNKASKQVSEALDANFAKVANPGRRNSRATIDA
jgi:phasin family protein